MNYLLVKAIHFPCLISFYPLQLINFVTTEEISPGLHPCLPLFMFHNMLDSGARPQAGCWGLVSDSVADVAHLMAWGYAEQYSIVFGSLANESLEIQADMATAMQNDSRPTMLAEATTCLLRLQVLCPTNVVIEGEKGWFDSMQQTKKKPPEPVVSEAAPEDIISSGDEPEARPFPEATPPRRAAVTSRMWQAAAAKGSQATPEEPPLEPAPKTKKRPPSKEPEPRRKKAPPPAAKTKICPVRSPFTKPKAKETVPPTDTAAGVAARLQQARLLRPSR